MTDPLPLPALLDALAREALDLAADLQAMERGLIAAIRPMLWVDPAADGPAPPHRPSDAQAAEPDAPAGQPDRTDLAAALQRLDPVLQRLTALSRIAARAAAEVPPLPLPAATAALAGERLAALMPDLQPGRTAPPQAGTVTLFDPHP